MKEYIKEKLLIFVIIIVILCGIIIRVLFVYNHFAHCDDVCVVSVIFSKISNINSANLIHYLINRIKICFGFMTYAPLQLFFTSVLINENFSYRINLVLGRLPSLLCGIISMILFAKLVLIKFKDNKFKYIYALFTVVLISFSWENIIYSAQMEPYEIIVLFGIVVLYAMNSDILKNKNTMLLYCSLFIIGCYAHFQFYYIIFSFYVSYFIDSILKIYKDKHNIELMKLNVNRIKNIVLIGMLNFVFTIPGINSFIKTGMLEKSVNWNAGKNMMFLYNGSNGVLYTIKFFIKNIIILVRYFYTVSNISFFSTILSISLVLLSIFGLINLYKKRLEFIFYILLYGIVCILILLSKLTLGPSRHFLFIFPFFLYLVIEGIDYLNFIMLQNYKISIIFGILLMINIIMFICFFSNEYKMRKDYANEKEMNNLAKEYDVDAIYFCYDYSSHQLFNIKDYTNINYRYDYTNGFFVKDKNNVKKNEYNIMIVSRHQELENFLLENDRFKSKFLDYLNIFDISNIDKYKVIYSDEIFSNYEIEYDSRDYWNFPNGKHLYIVKFYY